MRATVVPGPRSYNCTVSFLVAAPSATHCHCRVLLRLNSSLSLSLSLALCMSFRDSVLICAHSQHATVSRMVGKGSPSRKQVPRVQAARSWIIHTPIFLCSTRCNATFSTLNKRCRGRDDFISSSCSRGRIRFQTQSVDPPQSVACSTTSSCCRSIAIPNSNQLSA